MHRWVLPWLPRHQLSHEKINLPRHPIDNLGELDPPGKAHALTSAATIAAPYSVARAAASDRPHP